MLNTTYNNTNDKGLLYNSSLPYSDLVYVFSNSSENVKMTLYPAF